MSDPNNPNPNGDNPDPAGAAAAAGMSTTEIACLVGGIVAFLLCCSVCKFWLNGGSNKNRPDLTGKVIIVTGSNTGIGFHAAEEMAKLGAKTVIMACRSETRALAAIATIQKNLQKSPSNTCQVEFMKLDLADLKSVKQFADNVKAKYSRIDILVNNAGLSQPEKGYTEQKYDWVFGINHIGHFLLTKLLMEQIKASDEGRIIHVSSDAHEMVEGEMDMDNLHGDQGKFDGFKQYGKSKYAQVLFALSLKKKFEEEGITNVKTASLMPGVVRTEVWRNALQDWSCFGKIIGCIFCGLCCAGVKYFCCKSSFQGSQTTLYCCLCPFDELENGAYYKDCKVKKALLKDTWPQQAEVCWAKSEEMIKGFE